MVELVKEDEKLIKDGTYRNNMIKRFDNVSKRLKKNLEKNNKAVVTWEAETSVIDVKKKDENEKKSARQRTRHSAQSEDWRKRALSYS